MAKKGWRSESLVAAITRLGFSALPNVRRAELIID